MPELPRLTAKEAEKLLLQSGFIFSRQKGSHRIYVKDKIRQVLPFHSAGEILHPKIVKEIMENILK
ncbi:type II toxin-antitoxin system HicA family toxin [Helicobacter pylori]|uniref:type II toxin-antitoxin system HicA family toxin n=1 Tax=Helicobacter pylori TaxID=210 RepID=UPI000EAB80F3|nr:type II toxin-antitoxin system HicA family toxin [Helicobacter pylori]